MLIVFTQQDIWLYSLMLDDSPRLSSGK